MSSMERSAACGRHLINGSYYFHKQTTSLCQEQKHTCCLSVNTDMVLLGSRPATQPLCRSLETTLKIESLIGGGGFRKNFIGRKKSLNHPLPSHSIDFGGKIMIWP